jgi:molecular chaperone GrpE
MHVACSRSVEGRISVVWEGSPDLEQGDPQLDPASAESDAQTRELLAGIRDSVRELADSTGRYHTRAEQRERAIEHLHSEVDRLRLGERRGLLRPLLVEICRLRTDLLRQAEELPGDFDAERARLLLRSYAESVESALEDNGVVAFAPACGTRFEPRMHRRVGGEPTDDPALAGCVALVRRSGYLDIDANSPIALAEVVVFGPAGATAAGTDERTEL